jgi:hypothetical protein
MMKTTSSTSSSNAITPVKKDRTYKIRMRPTASIRSNRLCLFPDLQEPSEQQQEQEPLHRFRSMILPRPSRREEDYLYEEQQHLSDESSSATWYRTPIATARWFSSSALTSPPSWHRIESDIEWVEHVDTDAFDNYNGHQHHNANSNDNEHLMIPDL